MNHYRLYNEQLSMHTSENPNKRLLEKKKYFKTRSLLPSDRFSNDEIIKIKNKRNYDFLTYLYYCRKKTETILDLEKKKKTKSVL